MKKARIIRTPFVYPIKHFSSITAVPDIGTAYINAIMQSIGYESKVIDAAGEGINQKHRIKDTELAIGGITAEDIVGRIPHDVTMIGMQSMHSNRWIYDSHILKRVLEKFPDKPVFLGGEHVTAAAGYILRRFPQVTACVLGEGEETVVELVKAIEEGTPLRNVAGIAFFENGAVRFTEKRKRNKAVSDIPNPSWDGVPLAKYLHNHCGINSLSKKSIPMLATRGCPYSCTFCTVPNMWDSKWFARDQKEVVDEIESYVKDFGVEHIDFVDLTLVVNKKWMHGFCDELIARKLNVTWAIPIGTRTEGIDKDLLLKMRKSGLQRVLYSAESGSEATLLRINKCLTLEHFEYVVKESSKLGIVVKIAFIFGFPGQTLKEVFQSFLLINRLVFLGARDIVCLSFIPYPKTELYDELNVSYNYNDPKNNIRLNNDIPNMQSWSDSFGNRTLQFFIWFFTLYFYALQGLVKPHRVIGGFYRVFIKKLPLTNFESIIFNMIRRDTKIIGEVEVDLDHSSEENKYMSKKQAQAY